MNNSISEIQKNGKYNQKFNFLQNSDENRISNIKNLDYKDLDNYKEDEFMSKNSFDDLN